MEKYLKMSLGFTGRVGFHVDELWACSGFVGKMECQHKAMLAAHAINSHDELVAMNKELLEVLEAQHTVACVLMARFSSTGMIQEWHKANEMAEKIELAINKAKAAS
ncbi:MAG: hypothetical protein ACRCXB_31320 [Aeromonadaceae bacterium]